MASNYTSNYGLCQWQASDKVLRTEFNADNARIDAALASKASVSALNALTQTVNGKAGQSALDAVRDTVAGHGTMLDLRNCRFAAGTYKGTGKWGQANPNTLTFSQKPVFLAVASPDKCLSFFAILGQSAAYFYYAGGFNKETVTWKSKSVSWYSDTFDSSPDADKQMNASNATYHYFAILAIE